jgi:hypothetical protein
VAGTFKVTGLAFLAGTWPLALLAGLALMPRRTAADGERGLVRALALALGLGLGTVVAQAKFFPYHWIILWSPLALLAGLGAARVAALWPGAGAGGRRGLAIGLTLAALAASALAGAPGWAGYSASLQRSIGRLPTAGQQAVFRVQGMGMDELARVARQVAAATPPGSPLLLWGFEPAFYLYAGRDFPGRFPFAYPLVTPWAPREWRHRWLAELQARPPAAVVVRRGDPIPWVAGIGGDAAARLRRLPELEAILSRDYRPRPDLSSRHMQVWLRVADPAARR